MSDVNPRRSIALGLFICLGLTILGFTLRSAVIRFKEFERTVSVKGLSERDLPADIALWPIRFTSAHNELNALYVKLESDTQEILAFVRLQGFDSSEVTVSAPAITDKLAQQYGNPSEVGLRYVGSQTVTVYTPKVEGVRSSIKKLAELGKKGVVLSGQEYQSQTEYLFTRLNEVKPEMIEEATRAAREVAEKFAKDSESKLGKIKTANQGQFTITDRDSNTPHIKKVRVVATVEYYLSD
jgi:hypothetical protein